MAETVVIDPGHGGSLQSGRSTPVGVTGPRGLLEKDLTLDLARRLRSELVERGFRVVLTRDGDVNPSLGDRVAVARAEGADAFLSLHFNGSRAPSEQGSEVWIHELASVRSRALAGAVQAALLAALGLPDRGVRAGVFAVLDPIAQTPSAAACLVEVAFLTDPVEESRLADDDHRRRIAGAIAGAVALGARSGDTRWRTSGRAQRFARQRQGAPGILPVVSRRSAAPATALQDHETEWQRVVVGESTWDQVAGALFEEGAPVELVIPGPEAGELVRLILQQAADEGLLQHIVSERSSLPAFAVGQVVVVDDAIIIALIVAAVVALGLAALVSICILAGMGVLAYVMGKAIDNDYEVIDGSYSGGGAVQSILPMDAIAALVGMGGGGGGGGTGQLPGPIAGLLPGGGGGGGDQVSSDQQHMLSFKLRKRAQD